MNTPQKVFKNTAYQILGQFFHVILSVATIALIARYLGVESYGKFSLILVILSFFIILTDFGVNDIVVRELSRDKSRTSRIIYDLIFLKLLLGIAAIGFSILAVFLLNYSEENISLYSWASIALLFMALGSIGNNIIFKVNLWMERAVIALVAKDIAFLGFVYVAISLQGSLLTFIWAFLFANFVNLGATFFLMRDVMNVPQVPFDFYFWKKIIRNAMPLGLAYLIVTLYVGIDTILLDKLVGKEAVGYYNAAYRLIFQAVFIPVAFINSLFPLMSEYWNSDRDKLKDLFQKAFDYTVLIAIPFGIAMTIVAPKIILFIYGDEYSQSTIPLQILSWGMVIMYPGIIVGYMMVVMNEQRKSLVINICALIVNISLNFLLIPIMTFIGASIVTIITELVAITPTIYFVQKKLNYTLSLDMLFKSVLISIPCTLLLLLSSSFNLFIQLSIFILGYMSFVCFIKLIPKKDLQLLWQKANVRSAVSQRL